jgi:hypothetical protein
VYRWSKVTLASSVPETLKVTVVFSVFFLSFMLCFNMFRIGSKRPTHVARGYNKAMRIGSNMKVSGKDINDVITNPSMKEGKFPGAI